ncbi:MAG: hypothetical protein D6702_00885 [Planctomycetota bacterium]|nr:MAG: hypothetical protein D6702_00885 [Planctomycetota bacterium]
MPVWHEALKKIRRETGLAVVGITQEQHPERCSLFRQWQELDWPILWDPFNLTGAEMVPNFTAVDEHGVVRLRRARLESFRQDFLDRTFPASGPPADRLEGVPGLGAIRAFLAASPAERDVSALVAALEDLARKNPKDAALSFRLGVALRLRHDSPARRPDDFGRAVAVWSHALALRPGQYIWRRRIQQYGPRMDKPYPFYDWIGRAQAELRARGEEPVAQLVPLAAAERAEPSRGPAATGKPPVEPDPRGGVPADPGFVRLETVAVPGTGDRPVWRLYLSLAPAPDKGVSWDNGAGPLQVWLDAGSLPAGALLDRQLLEAPLPDREHSSEERVLEAEIALPAPGAGAAELRGYAVFGICEEQTGACRWLRRDFRLPLVWDGA